MGSEMCIRDRRALCGSDAHYVSPLWFLTCATAFEDTITSEAELVEALHYGTYRPLRLPRMDAENSPGTTLSSRS